MVYKEISKVNLYFTQNNDSLYLGAFKDIDYYQRGYHNKSNWTIYAHVKSNSDNLNHFLMSGNFNLYISYIVKDDKNEEKALWFKLSDTEVFGFREIKDEDSNTYFSYEFNSNDCLLISESLLPNEVKSRL